MTEFQKKFTGTVYVVNDLTDTGKDLYMDTLTSDDLPRDLVEVICKCDTNHERITLDVLKDSGVDMEFDEVFEGYDFNGLYDVVVASTMNLSHAKVGDLVRWNGNIPSAWNSEMFKLGDGKPRKILAVEELGKDDDGYNAMGLDIEGIDSSLSNITGWAYSENEMVIVQSYDDILDISEEERDHKLDLSKQMHEAFVRMSDPFYRLMLEMLSEDD